MSETIHYSVVGPGRVGLGLIRALDAISNSSTRWKLIATYGRGDDVSEAAAGVDVMLLTVPDDAIATVALAVRPADAVVVHMAGAKTLEVLRPHGRVASVHPLAPLPDPTTAAERLASGIAFAIAGDPIAERLVSALNGKSFEVPDHLRTRYHATAAVAANHLVVLCAQVERLAATVGIPADQYWDLMAATLENVRATSARAALTGPASRGDRQTIEAHMADLPPTERPLYKLMADEAEQIGLG